MGSRRAFPTDSVLTTSVATRTLSRMHVRGVCLPLLSTLYFYLIGCVILPFAIHYHNLDDMATAKVRFDTWGGSFPDQRFSAPPLGEVGALVDWSAMGFRPAPYYNWEASTEENYGSSDNEFYGRFKHIRSRLDYGYHSNYSRARQLLQDAIIEQVLNSKVTDETHGQCNAPSEPWIVFTAGVMGAGKTHTVRRLHAKGVFPLESFVIVDPDDLRRLLPEFNMYLEVCAEQAGAFTRKEAGMMAEILTEAALERGQNVLKDGSLRDAHWYQKYFAELRQFFPGIKLGIIHVTAPFDVILERVEERARSTGRIVPKDVLLAAADQVPKSVHILSRFVDLFLEINNSGHGDADIVVTSDLSTESARKKLARTCGP